LNVVDPPQKSTKNKLKLKLVLEAKRGENKSRFVEAWLAKSGIIQVVPSGASLQSTSVLPSRWRQACGRKEWRRFQKKKKKYSRAFWTGFRFFYAKGVKMRTGKAGKEGGGEPELINSLTSAEWVLSFSFWRKPSGFLDCPLLTDALPLPLPVRRCLSEQ
jgi:hypothetical protein